MYPHIILHEYRKQKTNCPGKRPQTVWGAKGFETSGGDDDDDDDTQMRTQRSRHMRAPESRHSRAHTWEHTAHICEHTYESTHMRAHI